VMVKKEGVTVRVRIPWASRGRGGRSSRESEIGPDGHLSHVCVKKRTEKTVKTGHKRRKDAERKFKEGLKRSAEYKKGMPREVQAHLKEGKPPHCPQRNRTEVASQGRNGRNKKGGKGKVSPAPKPGKKRLKIEWQPGIIGL